MTITTPFTGHGGQNVVHHGHYGHQQHQQHQSNHGHGMHSGPSRGPPTIPYTPVLRGPGIIIFILSPTTKVEL